MQRGSEVPERKNKASIGQSDCEEREEPGIITHDESNDEFQP